MKDGDLFETLRETVNCACISDMRFAPYRDKARRELTRLDLAVYPLSVLEDMSEYLYESKLAFSNMDEAVKFFRVKAPRM